MKKSYDMRKKEKNTVDITILVPIEHSDSLLILVHIMVQLNDYRSLKRPLGSKIFQRYTS